MRKKISVKHDDQDDKNYISGEMNNSNIILLS